MPRFRRMKLRLSVSQILFFRAEFNLFAVEYHVGCSYSTHFSAHRAGVPVSGRSALKVSTCLFSVNSNVEHFLPVNSMTGLCHCIITVCGVRYALCYVSCMSGNKACDYTFLNVVGIVGLGAGNGVGKHVCGVGNGAGKILQLSDNQ